jgi:diadenylate cyclase
MTSLFERLQAIQLTWRDAIDITIVAFILYNILALIRGTRAMQISIGLVLLGSSFFIARAFDLAALEAISREILFYLPFAVIVLFQTEIRRALARMGTNPLLWFLTRRATNGRYEAVLSAAAMLAARRVGALIVIERTQSLRMYAETATPLDASLSAELLASIFTPGSPLHDGAVIVQGSRIVAAGAFLPLTATADASLGHGTRHRAGIGISEETDAFVIIVSEENGVIAAASEGKLVEHIDGESLAALMEERLGRGRG